MIILIGGQKGGCGKTTLALNIAVALQQKNKSVALIDIDPQKSLSAWVELRQDNKIKCIDNINNIAAIKKQYKYIIIDIAGRVSRDIRQCLMLADVFIVPGSTSLFDIQTLERLYLIIKEAQSIRRKLKTYYIFNNINSRSKKKINLAKEIMEDYKKITILNSVIAHRSIYLDSIAKGLGVLETPNKTAILEFNKVIKELFNE